MSWMSLSLALLSLGWSDITLSPSKGDRLHQAYQRSIAGLDRPSERTVQTLKRLDLERSYRRDAENALRSLENAVLTSPEPELVYAMAELSWIEGKRLDKKRNPVALHRYIDVVAYSYDFLCDPELAAGRQPSDPRFRLAMDLYNGGLERLIRAAQSEGRIEPEGTIRLKVHGKEQVFRVSLQDSPWTANDVDQIILCSDFEVAGLISGSYQYGLGVPLIGVRHTDKAMSSLERFYPPEMAFPLTAFMRPNSKLRSPMGKDAPPREVTIELIDPVRHRALNTEPPIALESDLTTPLAYMWSRTDLSKYRWTGLLKPDQAQERAGLMLIRPYEKGKIPVVMVHGLASSPLAWIPMLNELLRDPRIQSRYQFMLYVYPTGVPIPIAAAGLRDALGQAEAAFNPSKDDPAFDQMILLGHSMGGLLSHAMSVHSDDKFWELNSDKRFEEIVGPPEVLAELRRYYKFEPLPFVKRVVFMATPHRGSELSRGVVGRVSNSFIGEPDRVINLLGQLLKENPDAFDRRNFQRLPTSIETLRPDSKILLALMRMRPNQGVIYHSVMGALKPGPRPETTDGVVPYTSSIFEGVASELVVRSDHGVQKNPQAILEVRRILLEHTAKLEGGASQTAQAPQATSPR